MIYLIATIILPIFASIILFAGINSTSTESLIALIINLGFINLVYVPAYESTRFSRVKIKNNEIIR